MGTVNHKKGSSGNEPRYKAIGERLQYVFRDNAHSLESKIGVSDQTLGRYFRGQAFPKHELLYREINARGFSVDWVLFGIGEPSLAATLVESNSPELLADYLATFPDDFLGTALRSIGPRKQLRSAEPQ